MFLMTRQLVLAAGSLVVLAGLNTPTQAAPPYATPGLRVLPAPTYRPLVPSVRPIPPIGGDPRTWSRYPINPIPPIGRDPRTWSPYPYYPIPPIGSDPRTWSPYPYYPDYRPYPNRYYPDYQPYPLPWYGSAYQTNPYLPGSSGR